MGRLPAVRVVWLGALAVCLLTACDNGKKRAAPLTRREAVIASGPTKDAPAPTAKASTKPVHKPRAFCTGASLNRDFPSQQVGHGEAPGAEALGTKIRVGNGRWVWLNLWAAWCGPCKEELPRLFGWQKQLQDSTDFVFLSLDDDQRQFLRFLKGQPKDGLRSSFWLPEGKTRTSWLTDLGIDTAPELPIQILVDPRGKVHCIIQGAVEDVDLPRVRQIVAGR